MAGWPLTVGVIKVGVSASQEQTLSGTGARVYTAHGLTGRDDGYQCSLDWGRSSISYASVHNMRNMFVTLFTNDIKIFISFI